MQGVHATWGAWQTLRFQALFWLRGEGSYAYVHLKNLSDPALVFPHTPSLTLRAFLEAAAGSNLALRGWITHASSRFTRIEGTALTELYGYVTVDLEATCGIRQGIQFGAGVRNVLDANYDLAAGYPEPGRSMFVRMSYAFQH